MTGQEAWQGRKHDRAGRMTEQEACMHPCHFSMQPGVLSCFLSYHASCPIMLPLLPCFLACSWRVPGAHPVLSCPVQSCVLPTCPELSCLLSCFLSCFLSCTCLHPGASWRILAHPGASWRILACMCMDACIKSTLVEHDGT